VKLTSTQVLPFVIRKKRHSLCLFSPPRHFISFRAMLFTVRNIERWSAAGNINTTSSNIAAKKFPWLESCLLPGQPAAFFSKLQVSVNLKLSDARKHPKLPEVTSKTPLILPHQVACFIAPALAACCFSPAPEARIIFKNNSAFLSQSRAALKSTFVCASRKICAFFLLTADSFSEHKEN
jgi:hypothetical protein